MGARQDVDEALVMVKFTRFTARPYRGQLIQTAVADAELGT